MQKLILTTDNKQVKILNINRTQVYYTLKELVRLEWTDQGFVFLSIPNNGCKHLRSCINEIYNPLCIMI